MITELVLFFAGAVTGYLIHDRYKNKLDGVMGALKSDKGSMFYQPQVAPKQPALIQPVYPIADLPM